MNFFYELLVLNPENAFSMRISSEKVLKRLAFCTCRNLQVIPWTPAISPKLLRLDLMKTNRCYTHDLKPGMTHTLFISGTWTTRRKGKAKDLFRRPLNEPSFIWLKNRVPFQCQDLLPWKWNENNYTIQMGWVSIQLSWPKHIKIWDTKISKTVP